MTRDADHPESKGGGRSNLDLLSISEEPFPELQQIPQLTTASTGCPELPSHRTFLAGGCSKRGRHLYTILLIILILLLMGALPTWPYSSSWGYYPSGGLGLVLLIVIILLLMGRL